MATRFWVGGTGTWDNSNTTNWSATTGGAGGASVPVAGDTANFDANSGSGICTTGTGATATAVNFNSSTLELKLGQNLTTNGRFTLTAGTLNLNSFKFTCTDVVTSNSNVRSIVFGDTGSFDLTQSASSVWSGGTTTNLTTSGSKTVNVTAAASTGTRTINPGNPGESVVLNFNITAGTDTVSLQGSYRNLNLTGFAGTVAATARNIWGDFTVPSGVTFAANTNATVLFGSSGTQTITTNGVTLDMPITVNASGATKSFADALNIGTRTFTITNGTVKFKNNATTTVGGFATSGTAQKFLESSTAGLQATISQSSGNVSVNYLSIKDINATGGANWVARTDLGSKDLGNNTGWNFIYIAIQQILKPIMDKILKPIILN